MHWPQKLWNETHDLQQKARKNEKQYWWAIEAILSVVIDQRWILISSSFEHKSSVYHLQPDDITNVHL